MSEDENNTHNNKDSSASFGEKGLRWYVIHVHSSYEAYVIRTLNDRIQVAGVEHRFGEIIVPTEEVIEMRGGKKRKVERKFFPGYILLQIDMDSDMWYLVRNTPKVLGFIGGTSEKPAPISDEEAMSILQRVEEGEKKPRHKVLFEPGEFVRVKDGPFADFNGTVEDVNYDKSRLKVSVSIFGRSTPVELEFSQVEKA